MRLTADFYDTRYLAMANGLRTPSTEHSRHFRWTSRGSSQTPPAPGVLMPVQRGGASPTAPSASKSWTAATIRAVLAAVISRP